MRLTVHLRDGLGTSVSAFMVKALDAHLNEKKRKKRKAGSRLLELVRPGSISTDVWDELEKGRAS
jgi:hypothetical protein